MQKNAALCWAAFCVLVADVAFRICMSAIQKWRKYGNKKSRSGNRMRYHQ